jgi:CBS-domain-containing membrane protein
VLSLPVVRLLWCILGAAGAIALSLSVAGPPLTPFLLASLGGSAVFLFGLTRAPAAQPRALLGGHLSGALMGIACYQAFGDGLWVYALALGLALVFMLVTRTVHPPAGANPILMVYVHAGWSALWQPVLLGVGSMMLLAVVWSRLYPGLSRYPVSLLEPSPPSVTWGGWLE